MAKASIPTITAAQVKNVEQNSASTAAMLAALPDLGSVVQAVIDTGEDNKRSPMAIHRVLRDELTGEDRATWPILGSKPGEYPNGGFDLYEYVDGNGSTKQGSYWRNVAKMYPIGSAIHAKLKSLADSETVKNEYSGMGEAEKIALKKRLNAQFTYFNTNFRMAVQLFDRMEQANEELPLVSVTYCQRVKRDDKGKLVMNGDKPVMVDDDDSVTPIKVSDTTDASRARYFTVANFLKLKVEETKAKGGLWEDFILSNKRQPKTPENVSINVTNIDQFEDATIALEKFLKDIKAAGKIGELVKFYQAAGSDDRVATLFTMIEDLSILTELPALKKRADDLAAAGYEPKAKAA